jgi:hypothetical protein
LLLDRGGVRYVKLGKVGTEGREEAERGKGRLDGHYYKCTADTYSS